MKQRQIFAIGGKFFVEPWETPALQQHLLSLSPEKTPKICLLAGASGDNPNGIELFYRTMNEHDCRPKHLNMYHPVTRDFEDYFLSMDIIYVGGGATKNLISVWRDWGIDKALRTAWENGVVLSGTSAGSICWFESGLTDSFPPVLLPLDCLGFLAGSACPHYGSRPDRAPSFRRLINEEVMPAPGLGIDDHCAAHFIGEDLHELVTTQRGAGGHLVMPASETPIEARFIG